MPGALHLRPHHSRTQIRTPPQKHLMIICTSIRTLSNPAKPIQIQLSLKGGNLRLTKIPRHNHRGKLLRFAHDEGPSMRQPGYNARIPPSLFIQHVHQFLGKWLSHATRLFAYEIIVRNLTVIMIYVWHTLLFAGLQIILGFDILATTICTGHIIIGNSPASIIIRSIGCIRGRNDGRHNQSRRTRSGQQSARSVDSRAVQLHPTQILCSQRSQ
mmetsp:Transcript_4164/g.6357  ORF Transcript_4164/g.6357 Transcript_4164/m.6357 type:complete len:214 (-) Transcript_4164:46-687(-)